MIGRSHLSDEELIRYLEGEVTQSKAGKIVLLTQASAVERERVASLERMLALVARPADEVADIDLVAGVWDRIEQTEGAPPNGRRSWRAIAGLCAMLLLAVILGMPMTIADDPPPEPRQAELEQAILRFLDL